MRGSWPDESSTLWDGRIPHLSIAVRGSKTRAVSPGLMNERAPVHLAAHDSAWTVYPSIMISVVR